MPRDYWNEIEKAYKTKLNQNRSKYFDIRSPRWVQHHKKSDANYPFTKHIHPLSQKNWKLNYDWFWKTRPIELEIQDVSRSDQNLSGFTVGITGNQWIDRHEFHRHIAKINFWLREKSIKNRKIWESSELLRGLCTVTDDQRLRHKIIHHSSWKKIHKNWNNKEKKLKEGIEICCGE